MILENSSGYFQCTDDPLLMDRQKCPACLSWSTFSYSGGAFFGCSNCKTIAAMDRRTTAVYDAEYVDTRYNRYKTTRQMSELRISVLHRVLRLYESPGLEAPIHKGPLLDVGYGNGDFIRTAQDFSWYDSFGSDVNPTKYERVRRVDMPCRPHWPTHYRVITFFDCLEHFEDLTAARWCSHATDWLLLSFPAIPDSFPFDPNWKHNRPGEHHMHFDPKGLEKVFSHNGRKAELVYWGNPEDSIRIPADGLQRNIWTCALRCSSD